jgi:hypothetical protein
MARILGFILLLLVGSGSLVYGLLFHRVTVEENKKREVSVPVLTMPGLEESAPAGGGESATPESKGKSKEGPDADDGNPFRSPSDESPAANAENPFESHSETPPPSGVKFEKVTEEYVDVMEVPEWAIVRDVTVGGVVLESNGCLKRTYSGNPPSLCPT